MPSTSEGLFCGYLLWPLTLAVWATAALQRNLHRFQLNTCIQLCEGKRAAVWKLVAHFSAQLMQRQLVAFLDITHCVCIDNTTTNKTLATAPVSVGFVIAIAKCAVRQWAQSE